MNNLDTNDNKEKYNLLKQIYEYKGKGYELNKNYSISDDINELKYQLEILKENKLKIHIENQLKIYELIFKLMLKN